MPVAVDGEAGDYTERLPEVGGHRQVVHGGQVGHGPSPFYGVARPCSHSGGAIGNGMVRQKAVMHRLPARTERLTGQAGPGTYRPRMLVTRLTATLLDDQGETVHITLDPGTGRSICEKHPRVQGCDHRRSLIELALPRGHSGRSCTPSGRMRGP